MAEKVIITDYPDGSRVMSNIRNSKGVPVFGKNETYTATKVSNWYNGDPMTPDKVDGLIYMRQKGTGDYYKVNLPNDKELFLEKDTMAQMRALSSTEILLLKMGYYKGVKLNGYYATGDTPNPINYLLSPNGVDDGGSIIQVGNIILKHIFVNKVHVDYFGAKGDGISNDAIYINKACLYGCLNINLNPNKTYLCKDSIVPIENQLIDGKGAIIKRGNESKTTLVLEANEFSTKIVVQSIPSDWKIGDTIHIFKGVDTVDTTSQRKITNITNNEITVDVRFGRYIGEAGTSPTFLVGYGVRKVFNLINGNQYPVPAKNKILNIRFNGNRSNNTSNYWWFFNSNVCVYGYGSEVANCDFEDIPNENIVTSGSRIINNTGRRLNGSFCHLSSPRSELGQPIQGTYIAGNTVLGTNAINPTITQHSNAVIEQSWNAGKTIIIGNTFSSENKFGQCYDFTKQSSNPDADSDLIIVANNLFMNYAKISNDVIQFQTWDMNNRSVIGNTFTNCGTVNYSHLNTKKVIFINNDISGDTNIQNLVVNKTYKEDFKNGFNTQNFLLRDASNVGKLVFACVGDTIYIQDTKTPTPKVYFQINVLTGELFIGSGAKIGSANIAGLAINNTSTSLTKAQLNTTYPISQYPIGTRVICTAPSIPLVFDRLKNDEWNQLTVNLVS